MKTYLVTNIDYDLDDEVIELPNVLEIDVPDFINDYEIYNYLSDKISDITGFCVSDFDSIIKIKNGKKARYNVVIEVELEADSPFDASKQAHNLIKFNSACVDTYVKDIETDDLFQVDLSKSEDLGVKPIQSVYINI